MAKNFLDGLFLDEKMKTVRLETATFDEVFAIGKIDENTKPEVLTDEERLMNDRESDRLRCSAWFDAFLSNDQSVFFDSKKRGVRELLQYRICSGPYPQKGPPPEGPGEWLMDVAKTCISKIIPGKVYFWSIFRTIEAKDHASLMLKPEVTKCTVWQPRLDFNNLMGKKIEFSFFRDCARTCPSGAMGCNKTSIAFREFAEFPTEELLKRQVAGSGNEECSLREQKN